MPPATKRRLQSSIVEEEQKRQQHILNMHNGMSNNIQNSNNNTTNTASVSNYNNNDMTLQYHDELSTMGMRIRQSVDQGYQMPSNYTTMNMNTNNQVLNGNTYNNNNNNNNTGFNGGGVTTQDNSSYTIPEYKRVPMHNFMGNPQQMLINQNITGSSTSSASSLESWENRVQERLCNIGNDGENIEIIENVLKRGYDDSF
ncbi:hypothetical protein ACO0RG_002101 [Hanseniaspora osmophila]|uniref:Damage-regulated import facilitator 1 n=1 Tax=Hanseniaspora osmophila TaxID=56408 RepID=A0A1E5RH97_9ASCO|nr:Damage-regulated import facilitator 1 [Hanseniaspora osmophila]